MRLFKSVPDAPLTNLSGKVGEKEPTSYNEKYGVIVDETASFYKKEIVKYLKSEKVSGSKMNHTFYPTGDVVEQTTFEKRLSDQLTHYFSTYGLRSLGINTKFMYVPHNWKELNLPERVKFDVITGVSVTTLKESCLELLESGVAMKQETIEDIMTVLDGCEYCFTGDEQIANNEAKMFIYDKTLTTPNDAEDLFRYIVYKATGKTSLVKDKQTFEAIKDSKYVLPTLKDDQLKELSKSFNRRKEYWLSFKSANGLNSSIVNKISKYSKKYHQPLEQDILNNLTQLIANGSIDMKKLKRSLDKAPIFRVIRALNGLGTQCANSKYSLYNIRNGKYFVKPNDNKSLTLKKTAKVFSLLNDHIASKVDTTKTVYIPEGVEYALPTSEKQFVGEVPNYSTVEVDPSERDILIGVYWKNERKSGHVDYDLSCQSIDGRKLGWNSRWTGKGLTYSGDITNAPNGAAEWMVVKEGLDASFQIVNNLYSSSEDDFPEFTIMVGYADRKNGNHRNYFIKPDDLLFSAKVKPIKRQTTIGVVSPVEGENKIRFTLLNSGNCNKNVSTGEGTVSFIDALLPRAENTLKINEFLNVCSDPDEADIDLSPSKITKTSLLDLIS